MSNKPSKLIYIFNPIAQIEFETKKIQSNFLIQLFDHYNMSVIMLLKYCINAKEKEHLKLLETN